MYMFVYLYMYQKSYFYMEITDWKIKTHMEYIPEVKIPSS